MKYTAVLVPNGTKLNSKDVEEHTYVAHIEADGITNAYATAQNVAAQSKLGPVEPIDWAVLFLCLGHPIDIKDSPEEPTQVTLTQRQLRILHRCVMHAPLRLTEHDATGVLTALLSATRRD